MQYSSPVDRGEGSDRGSRWNEQDKRLSAGIVDIIRSSVWVLMMGRYNRFEGFVLARPHTAEGMAWAHESF